MDSISEQRLLQTHPLVQSKIHTVATALAAQNIVIRVVRGLASWADQEKIWQQGRSTSGPIVTYAPPGHSMHEFGFAVDCEPSLNGIVGPYKPDGVAGSTRYLAMRAIAEAQGLVSGSRWSHPVDWPHLQLAGVPASPTDKMREDFARGGLDYVWANYDTGEYE